MDMNLLGLVLIAVLMRGVFTTGSVRSGRARGRPPNRGRGRRRIRGRPPGRGSRGVTGRVQREEMIERVAQHRAIQSSLPGPEACPVETPHADEIPVKVTETRPCLPGVVPSSNDSALEKMFEDHMQSFGWSACTNCRERVLYPSKSLKGNPCNKCRKHPSKFTAVNNMDPLDVPTELSCLSPIEVQLIAAVHPVISVYRVKGQQYAYHGQVINFPQDVQGFATRLPHDPKILSSILIVRRGNNEQYSDFSVNRKRVCDALHWLQANNPFYKDFVIDCGNLDGLPEDGNVSHLLQNVADLNAGETESEAESGIFDQVVRHSGVPIPPRLGQTDGIRNRLDEVSSVERLQWPETGSNAINEFTDEGYIARAFPALFPRGAADFRSPRSISVSPTEYFQHLMNYHDQRFAKDPRFRFFALNSTMRWQAITQGNVCVQRNSRLRNASLPEMREMLSKDPSLARQIMFYGSTLRGTRSFWFTRCGELLDMVSQLGAPTAFLTLSAADTHWPDLFKILDPEDRIAKMPEMEANRIRQRFVNDNPLVVATFFQERAEFFVKNTLSRKFKMKDYWVRYEWQHRGSAHIHFVVWLDDAPNINNLDGKTPEELLKIAAYFDKLVFAWNSGLDLPAARVHPCQKRLQDVPLSMRKQDYHELLNKVQRHTRCTKGYCLKKRKGSEETQCRFKFPFPLAEHSLLQKVDGRWTYTCRRNDPILNKNNPFIIQLWRANMDIQPVVSIQDVMNYIAKYAAKGEQQSANYEDILHHIVSTECNAGDEVKKAVRKLFVKSVAERDYSAQEIFHILMSYPLYHSSRDFVSITVREDDWICLKEAGEHVRGESIVTKYANRLGNESNREDLRWLSLHDIARGYSYRNRRWCRRRLGKEAVVRIFPKLSLSADPIRNEHYYQQQVILHVPWTTQTTLREDLETWQQAFTRHKANQIIPSDPLFGDCCDAENEGDELEDSEPVHVRSEWMRLAEYLPNAPLPQAEAGLRDFDEQCAWDANPGRFADYQKLSTFLSIQKGQPDDSEPSYEMPHVNLTKEQESILQLVKLQIGSLADPRILVRVDLGYFSVFSYVCLLFKVPRRVVVQGKAGSGKSTVIRAITATLAAKLGPHSFRLLAPTGVAAININGSTIHSALKLFSLHTVKQLQGDAERNFQLEYQSVNFIICDEYSMVGCR